jgi:peptidylprolyl isomerase
LVKDGDTVRVHYTGTLNDGTVFDSSLEREPLEFTLGAGSMIAGFEKAVHGMELGQSKKVTIPAAEAYGPHDPAGVIDIDRKQVPPNMSPQVGDRLKMREGDGGTMVVRVTNVTETAITVDANHEMAGKDLTFEIRLVEIKKYSAQ